MHRIDTSTAQKDKFGAGKNGFTLGNAQTGVPPTEVSADILDAIQEEICSVIESEGITLDKSKRDQLLQAINKKIENAPSATTEKKGMVRKATDDEALLGQSVDAVMSAKNVSDAVKNMIKQMFVGIPLAWPSSTPPSWGINMVGQAINPQTDPILASRYTNLIVPDHRAMTVRGYDNGRGVDIGRQMLSYQADSIKAISMAIGQEVSGNTGYMSSMQGPDLKSRIFPIGRDVIGIGMTAICNNTGGYETTVKSLAYNIITMRG